jgi:hypothetical protein
VRRRRRPLGADRGGGFGDLIEERSGGYGAVRINEAIGACCMIAMGSTCTQQEIGHAERMPALNSIHAVLLIASVLLGSGCNHAASWGGVESESGERAENKCTIQHLTHKNRICLVAWADGCTLQPDSKLRPAFNVWGHLDAPNDRELVWCFESSDGIAGQDGLLTIGELVEPKGKREFKGREYRLSVGALFLVHARKLPLRVEQVATDFSSLGPTPQPDDLLRVCAHIPEVVAFHAECMKR